MDKLWRRSSQAPFVLVRSAAATDDDTAAAADKKGKNYRTPRDQSLYAAALLPFGLTSPVSPGFRRPRRLITDGLATGPLVAMNNSATTGRLCVVFVDSF